jgi:hypothetical protein
MEMLVAIIVTNSIEEIYTDIKEGLGRRNSETVNISF